MRSAFALQHFPAAARRKANNCLVTKSNTYTPLKALFSASASTVLSTRAFANMSGPPVKDPPLLFTPGPLSTSMAVKEAMLRDVGSRDADFCRSEVLEVRRRLVSVASKGASVSDMPETPLGEC